MSLPCRSWSRTLTFHVNIFGSVYDLKVLLDWVGLMFRMRSDVGLKFYFVPSPSKHVTKMVQLRGFDEK